LVVHAHGRDLLHVTADVPPDRRPDLVLHALLGRTEAGDDVVVVGAGEVSGEVLGVERAGIRGGPRLEGLHVAAVEPGVGAHREVVEGVADGAGRRRPTGAGLRAPVLARSDDHRVVVASLAGVAGG